ncbi:hypothetical protein CEXT_598221 [Caerostris extrusa]|uniref:Uncharacterized protein n=1 Tax=Caerostris extrusa TaxID=172846 RepID=A0AAV4Q8W5_CAEEX|nr:hypothetical protein CEXT_598221 [Caerostris extrusa]
MTLLNISFNGPSISLELQTPRTLLLLLNQALERRDQDGKAKRRILLDVYANDNRDGLDFPLHGWPHDSSSRDNRCPKRGLRRQEGKAKRGILLDVYAKDNRDGLEDRFASMVLCCLHDFPVFG